MGVLRVQHSFQGPSGEARDQFVNVWHIKQPSELLVEGDGVKIATAIKAFYSDLTASGGSPFFSRAINHAGASVKIYNMASLRPRVVAYEEFYTPSFGHSIGGQANEVCVALSFNAEPQPGAIRARNRGRMFLGPLSPNIGTYDATVGDVEVSVDDRTGLLARAQATYAALFADLFVWSIYSPSTYNQVEPGKPNPGTSAAFEAATFPIFDFSVDNAMDTQRRRGHAPTARSVVPS